MRRGTSEQERGTISSHELVNQCIRYLSGHCTEHEVAMSRCAMPAQRRAPSIKPSGPIKPDLLCVLDHGPCGEGSGTEGTTVIAFSSGAGESGMTIQAIK